jgi:hypothetical protein
MCTYDYTPYTGCENGEQHYYIQWVKCNTAAEKGRYCSLETSHRVEQLRKLSSNVLSCPLHGPIAVQQFVLEPANAQLHADGHHDNTERHRARSTTRRATRSRARTPRRASPDWEPEQPVRREVCRRRSRREIVPDSSDSESSTSFSSRPMAAGRRKTVADRELVERRRSRMAQNTHRRSISADVSLPPVPSLSMRHGRSEVSLPLRTEFEESAEVPQPPTPGSQARPKNSLDIPRAIGIVGLPSSPDMHRRGSMHRTRNEGLLRRGSNEGQPELVPPLPTSPLSLSSESSPDQNPDLPFGNPTRRNRRTGPRSIHDRSVDTTMRRIDEHVGPEENDRTISAAHGIPTLDSHSSTTSPEPPNRDLTRTAPPLGTTTYHRRSDSRPRLNTLQIPPTRPQFQRDAYSAPTATPPETDINRDQDRPLRNRAKSLRNVPLSPTTTTMMEPLPPRRGSEHEETASLRSARSRRYENQVAEGRKWVAAREHMPLQQAGHGHGHGRAAVTDVLAYMSEPNLAAALGVGVGVGVVPPPGVTTWRESVDSGYRSGHQAQRSWESVVPGPSAAGAAAAEGAQRGGTGGKGGRNTLQKAPPQGQGQGLGLTQSQVQLQGQGQGESGRQRHTLAPLDLGAARLPPCALPVSLLSPSVQSDGGVSAAGKGPKGTLLQRMGLRRKLSGLLWDRNGQREVGVEG